MNFKALVPHDVNIYRSVDVTDGVVSPGAEPYLTIPQEQTPLRLVPAECGYAMEPVELDCPVSVWGPQKLNFVPTAADGVGYIVSSATVPYLPHYQGKFFVVDQPVRDGFGKIIGCLGLSQVVF